MGTPLRKAIQASPNLVDLRIGIVLSEEHLNMSLTLDDIFGETFTMPALKPRLQHLRALDPYWTSFRHAWGAISQLTSLDMPNTHPERTCGVWGVLANQGIRIPSITVMTLSVELVRYLTSFVGLEKLHIKGASIHADPGNLPAHLYNRVLPQHKATLTTFLVNTDYHRSRYMDWCPKPADLEAIFQCSLLVELSFPLLYYAPGGSIPLAEKLTSTVPVVSGTSAFVRRIILTTHSTYTGYAVAYVNPTPKPAVHASHPSPSLSRRNEMQQH
jgi:hypothetical protein